MDKIPLPTDNIYKFYALFGLLLVIFAFGAQIAVQRSTNDYLYRSYIELESLKTAEKPSPADVVKRDMLARLIEVAISDKKFYNAALGTLIAVGALGMGVGFTMWQKLVQPMQDKLIKLQIEKLEREMQSLPPILASKAGSEPRP